MTQIEIFEAEFDEDDWACCAYFPVEPYGRVQLAAQDTSLVSRKLLQDLADNWSGLWPKMRNQLEKGIASYRVQLDLSKSEFFATIGAVEEGCYKYEEANIHVSLNFPDVPVPVWDFFIRGSHIAHFQPVF
jgi:hypothetical protein